MPNSSAQNVSDLNFVPEEILAKKQISRKKSSLNKYGISVLIITMVLAVAVFGYSFFQNQQIENIQLEIEAQKAVIQEYQEFGKKGFMLAQRLDTASQIIASRYLFSKVITGMNDKTPSEISLTSFNLQPNGIIDISARAMSSYAPIAYFEDNLLQSSGTKPLFTDVQIGSATLNANENSVNFTVKVTFDGEVIKDAVNQ